ncbi:MAG: ABC transporter substrate-binding protein [Oscillatoria sp. PMC 1068.18]|nr:ABC transporter substrate-binding protein [Oscillatoria sp. PMC 1076.18]MEC4988557.1 ABC transporter substrate-binding protein [Oscillatoria sp. PMC 1068.18]
MTQQNETKLLLISLLATLVLVAGGIWWFTNSENFGKSNGSNNSDSGNSGNLEPKENSEIVNKNTESKTSLTARISEGDKILISGDGTQEKVSATAAIAKGNYTEAINYLQNSLRAKGNDPEALIYLNNARIGQTKSYTIVASMPIGEELDAAQEMLRGVAQAQQEINQAGGINGIPIKILIANDDNDPEIAEELAEEFVNNPNIFGVIGHFGSSVSLAAAEIYQANNLVMISPTSTSVELSTVGNYIFRTVPSDRFAGSALSRYTVNELKLQKAVVFFNSESSYSKSLKDEYTTALFGDGGEVIAEYDLIDPNFNSASAVNDAIAKGAEVLMLAANSATLDQALQVVQVNDKRLPLLAGDSAYKAKTLQIGRSDAVGMILAVPWHILADPDAEFPQAAGKLWGGEVNWRTALAYDATQALIAALKRNPSRSGVQQALSSGNFEARGASGDIRFLSSGDRNQAVQLVTIQPGSRTSFGYEFVPIP